MFLHDAGINLSPVFSSLMGLILLVLFILLAFTSAAEVAFFSLKPSRLKEIRVNDIIEDDRVADLLQDPRRLLATILILVNLLNVSIIILATVFSRELIHMESHPVLAFVLQVIVITVLILFFGEILPKVFATQYAENVAIRMARPLKVMMRVFYPFSQVLMTSTQLVDRRLAHRQQNISMSELDEAIDITTNEDTPEEERTILKGIVTLGEIEVSEIMKSRIFITAAEKSMDYSQLRQLILDSGYSRIPVYEESLDQVTGVLYTKDLLPYLDQPIGFHWQQLIRPAFYVPENKKINDLLEEFQRKKTHLAIVVDEYGGTSGLVTLEDILEEIVGEINDEFDTDPDEAGYKRLDDHNYLFLGETPITDFCRVLKIDPEVLEKVRGESGTLAGLILELTGSIPEVNEKVTYKRFIFRIEKVDLRRIHKIKVTLADVSTE